MENKIRALCVLVVCLVAPVVQAQTQEEWRSLVDVPHGTDDNVLAVERPSDGTTQVLLSREHDYWLQTFSPSGQLVLSKEVLHAALDKFDTFKSNTTGSIILDEKKVTRLSPDGNVMWQRDIVPYADYYGYCSADLGADGTVYAASVTEFPSSRPGSYDWVGILQHWDTQGHLLWSRSGQIDGSYGVKPVVVTQTNAHVFVGIGWKLNSGYGSLVQFDAQGNRLSETPDSSYSDTYLSDGQGGLYSIEYRQGLSLIGLARIGADGSKKWTRTLKPVTGTVESCDTRVSPDGDLFVMESVTPQGSDKATGYVTRVTPTGVAAWTAVLTTPGTCVLGRVTPVEDGALVSVVDGSPKENIVNLKLDSAGNFLWREANTGNPYRSQRTAGLFPIAGGFLAVQNAQSENQDWDETLRSYDATGHVIFDRSLNLGTSSYSSLEGATRSSNVETMVLSRVENRLSGSWIALSRLDKGGKSLWTKDVRPNGAKTSASPAALCTDAAGNTYVAEHTVGATDEYDLATPNIDNMVVHKLDVNGNELWTKVLGHNNVDPIGIVVSPNGDVFVAIETRAGIDVGRLVKLTSNGGLVWVEGVSATVESVKLHPDGVVVTGRRQVYGIESNCMCLFRFSGPMMWLKDLGRPTSNVQVAVARNGDIAYCANPYQSGPFLTTLDRIGHVVGSYSDLRTRMLPPGALCTWAPDGNVLVSYQQGSKGSIDLVTMKLTRDCSPLWKFRWDGPEHGNDIVEDLAVDESGDVLVTGFALGRHDNVNGRGITLLLSKDGKPVWNDVPDSVYHGASFIDGTTHDLSGFDSFAWFGPDENPFVARTIWNGDRYYDSGMIKYKR